MPDTYEATLDDFLLEMETLEDSFEKAVAQYEFPYRNGAILEDMGLTARQIRIRCYFWDDGADHATYDDHIDLLDHLESSELFELVHPQYGPMLGCVQSVSVRHDDRQRHAELDIHFIENMPKKVDDFYEEDEFYEDVEFEVEASFLDTIFGTIDSVTGEINGLVNAVTLPARQFLGQVEACISGLEATLNTITAPANSLISLVNYGTSLPGRLVGSVARCCGRYALLYDTLKSAPTLFMANLRGSFESLCRLFTAPDRSYQPRAAAVAMVSRVTRVVAAAHLSYQAALVYKADQERRQSQKKAEKTKSFSALGKYAPVRILPIMSVRDLEKSLFEVRVFVQVAIDEIRDAGSASTYGGSSTGALGADTGSTPISVGSSTAVLIDVASLKRAVLTLEQHVNVVKLEREKIVSVELDNPMPLHLVCLRYGLDYHAAERLIAINPRIKNPNKTEGTVNIYVG